MLELRRVLAWGMASGVSIAARRAPKIPLLTEFECLVKLLLALLLRFLVEMRRRLVARRNLLGSTGDEVPRMPATRRVHHCLPDCDNYPAPSGYSSDWYQELLANT